MPAFDCRIPATPRNGAVLKHLNATGQIAFDHYYEVDGAYALTLTSAEIEVLKLYGVGLRKRSNLNQRAKRTGSERVSRAPRDDTDDALLTGFVDQYLDAAEVAARFDALAAEFPALCHLSLLPHPTAGYDGATAALAGPASVQLLRITNDPADHSRGGFLLVCGTHAREWVNPLIAVEFAEQLLRNYELGASRLTVSLSWQDRRRQPELCIFDPAGRRVLDGDWGVTKMIGDGYLLARISRPMPGRWTIVPRKAPPGSAVAAFVRSPLQVHIRAELDGRRNGSVLIRARLLDRRVSRLAGFASLTAVHAGGPGSPLAARRVEAAWTDALPAGVGLDLRRTDRAVPFCAPLRPLEPAPHHKGPGADRTSRMDGVHRFSLGELPESGPYIVRLRAAGWLADSFRFERVALTTLAVNV